LLVSHSNETVMNFAERAVWIQHGVVQMEGAPQDVMPAYKERSESDLGKQMSS
jgi:ABC-type polysaccharide/polyol phosphate transport system ATPase subunit